jgi:Domain of unknown function (DUF6471)
MVKDGRLNAQRHQAELYSLGGPAWWQLGPQIPSRSVSARAAPRFTRPERFIEKRIAEKHGFKDETEAGITMKLKRGTFAAAFFLARLAAMELEGVVLGEI